MEMFVKSSWQGNVRELSNFVERSIVTSEQDIITPRNMPGEIYKTSGIAEDAELEKIDDLQAAMDELERRVILHAYSLYKTTAGVARHLNISQPTAYRKISKYLDKKD